MAAASYFALFMLLSVAFALLARRNRAVLSRTQRGAVYVCSVVSFVCAGALFGIAVSGDAYTDWFYPDGRRATDIIEALIWGYLSAFTACLFVLAYALPKSKRRR